MGALFLGEKFNRPSKTGVIMKKRGQNPSEFDTEEEFPLWSVKKVFFYRVA
jgi:hypothetical protein